mmetsp:Transcript_28901/g.112552  ORF Transcript_28901/g.112552 Transcript_28901/m.112552 type:complete len:115 (-) Transcript_28901:205-549(-)
MEALDIKAGFNAVLSTKSLDYDEIEMLLNGQCEIETLSPLSAGNSDASLVSNAMSAFQFEGPAERKQAVDILKSMNFGIKKLLMVLEMAKMDGPQGGGQYIQLRRLKDVLRNVS